MTSSGTPPSWPASPRSPKSRRRVRSSSTPSTRSRRSSGRPSRRRARAGEAVGPRPPARCAPRGHPPYLFDANETAGRGGSGGAPARPVSGSYIGPVSARGPGAGSRFVGTVGRIPEADQRRAVQVISAQRARRPHRGGGGMKVVGLVGVPVSGKSTLFTAVTRAGSHAGQANLAVVPVPDPRADVLTRMERSAKTVYAQVRCVEVRGGLSSAQGVAWLCEAGALAIVVRCFWACSALAAGLA